MKRIHVVSMFFIYSLTLTNFIHPSYTTQDEEFSSSFSSQDLVDEAFPPEPDRLNQAEQDRLNQEFLKACKHSRNKLAKKLLQDGADINAKDFVENGGNTALIIATQQANTRLVKHLLVHGANADARNSLNLTAFEEAYFAAKVDEADPLKKKYEDLKVLLMTYQAIKIANLVLATKKYAMLGNVIPLDPEQSKKSYELKASDEKKLRKIARKKLSEHQYNGPEERCHLNLTLKNLDFLKAIRIFTSNDHRAKLALMVRNLDLASFIFDFSPYTPEKLREPAGALLLNKLELSRDLLDYLTIFPDEQEKAAQIVEYLSDTRPRTITLTHLFGGGTVTIRTSAPSQNED